jgi:hypothetical protein
MGKCNITHNELAEALEITLDHLANICDAFDVDPNDSWELIEGIHFVWGPYKSRIFSAEGAVEICNYLEIYTQERPFFQRWKRWLLQRDRRLKGLMVAKRIQEVSAIEGQIVFRSGKAFLAPRACREVLGLGKRQDVLNRTFAELQRPENTEIESLKINSDFFENERKENYFSGSGLASLGKHLGIRLSQQHRQEWVKVVVDYAPPALATLEKHEAERDQRIVRAMDRVRKQAKGHCQLTGRRQSVHKFNLVVHHLFDRVSYPQFADMEVNLIAISDDIHNHFHQWMGGTHVPCTVKDMERFVEEFSNSLFPGDKNVEQATTVAIRLSNAKKALAHY